MNRSSPQLVSHCRFTCAVEHGRRSGRRDTLRRGSPWTLADNKGQFRILLENLLGQTFRFVLQSNVSIFRMFLPIHSSVACCTLSHQLIKNSSQRNYCNNSSGNVGIPQLHCHWIYFLLSFDFLLDFSCSYTSTDVWKGFCWTGCQ